MPNICTNSLRIIGSHESVAEVAMNLCQTHHVSVLEYTRGYKHESGAFAELGIEHGFRLPPEAEVVGWSIESFGTRELPEPDGAPRHYALALEFKTAWGPSDELLKMFSSQFPDVVVGVVYDEAMNSIWGAKAFAGGKQILDATTDDVPTDPSWEKRYEDADEDLTGELWEELDGLRDAWGLDHLRDVSVKQLDARQVERATGIQGRLKEHGWPRWSLVAHAANAEGFAGLKGAFLQLDTAEQMTAALEAEYLAATELKVASWVDTALFGDASPALPLESDMDMQVGGSYAALSLESFRDRHLELLGAIGQTTTDGPEAAPLAHALLASLSNPDIRLGCSMHPAVFLAASAAAALADGQLYSSAAIGIEQVLLKLALRTPRIQAAADLWKTEVDGRRVGDPMLRSVLALVAMPNVCQSQLKPARAAGVAPEFMLNTLLAPREFVESNTEVLTRLGQAFGGIQAFPPRLIEEIASHGSELLAAHQALVTAELMRDRIAHPPSPQPAERKRRTARL